MTSGIKKRLLVPLKRAVGAWVEVLPSVLWSLRTTPNASTQFTPFFMVYGAEAILPSDVRFNAPRVEAYNEEDADEAASTPDEEDLGTHVGVTGTVVDHVGGAYPIAKFRSQFDAVVIERDLARTLRGKISPVTTHATGPHEQAKKKM